MKNKTRLTRTLHLFVLALCLLFSAITARALDGTWTNTIDITTNRFDGVWSGATNWLNGIGASNIDSTAYFNTIDVASNGTIFVTADYDITNANLYFGDTVTANSVGYWVVTDGGWPYTLESSGPNCVIDVSLAQGANNNLLTGSIPTYHNKRIKCCPRCLKSI